MDKERIIAKIKEMDSYVGELHTITPETFEQYLDDDKTRRACERLLQISIETLIEIASEISKGLKTEMPADEDSLFDNMKKKKIISEKLCSSLKMMKGFRNILVHRYGEVNDRLVFDFIENDLADFENFRKEVLGFLKKG